MPDAVAKSATAFDGERRLASAPLIDVAMAVKAATAAGAEGPLLAFDDATGAVIDLDLRGSRADIADDVMIGPNVSIITSGHPVEPSRRRAFVIAKPIVIQRNVWIAAGATIIGGVTVGENSVVAAGSVVTKDVPPNTLVGGNPARVIRSIGDD